MNGAPITADQGARRTIISIDAMGGDRGPATVVAGISRSAKENPDIAFLLHGPKDELEKLVASIKKIAAVINLGHKVMISKTIDIAHVL